MGSVRVSIVKASGIKGNGEFMGGKFVRYDEDVAAIKTAVKKAIELAVGSIDAIIKPEMCIRDSQYPSHREDGKGKG